MTDHSRHAPLYLDAMALNAWLLQHLERSAGPLETRLVEVSLDLLLDLAFALKDRDRETHIEDADDALPRLRTLLMLAVEVGRLSPEQYGHVLGMADGIGRQLGGWKRALLQD